MWQSLLRHLDGSKLGGSQHDIKTYPLEHLLNIEGLSNYLAWAALDDESFPSCAVLDRVVQESVDNDMSHASLVTESCHEERLNLEKQHFHITSVTKRIVDKFHEIDSESPQTETSHIEVILPNGEKQVHGVKGAVGSISKALFAVQGGEGEWRMENGEWRMENGEWRMESTREEERKIKSFIKRRGEEKKKRRATERYPTCMVN